MTKQTNDPQQIERIRELAKERDIRVVVVGGADINGVFRGKRIPADVFLRDPGGPVPFSDYMWAMDVEQELIPPDASDAWWPRWDRGFEDFEAIPDLSTFRPAPWLDRTAFVLCDYAFMDGSPMEFSPRRLVQRLVERLLGHGYVAKMAPEFEFFLFRETSESLAAKGYQNAEPLFGKYAAYGVYRSSLDEELLRPIVDSLIAYGIPVEAWNPEGGAGQYEVNLVFDALPGIADSGFLQKHITKEVAAQHGMLATFMAKTLPGFGSSCHIHQSLWTVDGDRNAFYDGSDPQRLSTVARQYLAGQLSTMREMTLAFAPTINSYKRLVPESAAGTTATWAIENRTAGIRVLNANERGTRLEHRVAGGDVNAYLAMAACLAGGLYGMEHGLTPPAPIDRNAYEDPHATRIPQSIEEAIEAFEGSEITKEYLGEEFVQYFAKTRRWEIEQFRANVTDWECRRYLEYL